MTYGLEITRANGKLILSPEYAGGYWLGVVRMGGASSGSFTFTGVSTIAGRPFHLNAVRAGAHAVTGAWVGGELVVSWSDTSAGDPDIGGIPSYYNVYVT